MDAHDLRELAADLAAEHGAEALRYAEQTGAMLESEGATERAAFWQALSLLIDDIVTYRLDPRGPLTIH